MQFLIKYLKSCILCDGESGLRMLIRLRFEIYDVEASIVFL